MSGFKFFGTVFAAVLCLSTGLHQGVAKAKNLKKDASYAYNPQYEKYKDSIKTPLRGLKVPDNFTLVDDFDSFMRWHDKHTTGNWDDSRGFITYQKEAGVRIEKCADNAKTLTGTSAVSAGIDEGPVFTENDYRFAYTETQGRCQNVFAQRFTHNPKKGATTYADILRYWQANDVLKNINKTTKSIPTDNARRTSFTYATRSVVGDSMAHYALYHRLYGLDETEQTQIDEMFTHFVTTYDYYAAFKASGNYFARVCNLGKGATVTPEGTNDHCGSANLRIAVGATLYGLDFGNQIVFDYGIRQLEITLATFDENKAYTAQIYRGMLALGYARQIIAELDKLDYAFEKAFGLDFVNMKTPHGVTPGEVYQEMLVFATEPERLLYYFKNNGYGADERGGDFKATVQKIKEGVYNYRAVWEAFNEREYYALGGAMAQAYFPEKFQEYVIKGRDHKFLIEGSVNVGFNNLVLRMATGDMKMPVLRNKSAFQDMDQLIRQSDRLVRAVHVAQAPLVTQNMKCSAEITRYLKSSKEFNKIAEGYVTIKAGKLGLDNLYWETGNNRRWKELSQYTDISVRQDGFLTGRLPVFSMFGSEEIAVLLLAENAKAKGEAGSPNGDYKLFTTQNTDLEITLKIRACR